MFDTMPGVLAVSHQGPRWTYACINARRAHEVAAAMRKAKYRAVSVTRDTHWEVSGIRPQTRKTTDT